MNYGYEEKNNFYGKPRVDLHIFYVLVLNEITVFALVFKYSLASQLSWLYLYMLLYTVRLITTKDYLCDVNLL